MIWKFLKMKKLIISILILSLSCLLYNNTFSYDYPKGSLFREPYEVKNSLLLKIGITTFITAVTFWAYYDCKSFGLTDNFLPVFGTLAITFIWIKI